MGQGCRGTPSPAHARQNACMTGAAIVSSSIAVSGAYVPAWRVAG
jgi:hypothetical protein